MHVAKIPHLLFLLSAGRLVASGSLHATQPQVPGSQLGLDAGSRFLTSGEGSTAALHSTLALRAEQDSKPAAGVQRATTSKPNAGTSVRTSAQPGTGSAAVTNDRKPTADTKTATTGSTRPSTNVNRPATNINTLAPDGRTTATRTGAQVNKQVLGSSRVTKRECKCRKACPSRFVIDPARCWKCLLCSPGTKPDTLQKKCVPGRLPTFIKLKCSSATSQLFH